MCLQISFPIWWGWWWWWWLLWGREGGKLDYIYIILFHSVLGWLLLAEHQIFEVLWCGMIKNKRLGNTAVHKPQPMPWLHWGENKYLQKHVLILNVQYRYILHYKKKKKHYKSHIILIFLWITVTTVQTTAANVTSRPTVQCLQK